MATTYLANPSVTIGAVDVSAQCSAATVTVGYDSLESTAFGQTGRSYEPGLESVEVTLTLFNSYGTGEIEATLNGIVGTSVTLIILPADAAAGTSNPEHTITGAFLGSYPAIDATVGELSSIDVTFTGGTWVRATS